MSTRKAGVGLANHARLREAVPQQRAVLSRPSARASGPRSCMTHEREKSGHGGGKFRCGAANLLPTSFLHGQRGEGKGGCAAGPGLGTYGAGRVGRWRRPTLTMVPQVVERSSVLPRTRPSLCCAGAVATSARCRALSCAGAANPPRAEVIDFAGAASHLRIDLARRGTENRASPRRDRLPWPIPNLSHSTPPIAWR